jgi:glycosyltransferase involved in cell wall biosynthesis
MKKVSVIIPFFGQPDQLLACLTALAGQTLPPEQIEIIVVDNGSPHNLSLLTKSFRCVRCLREERPGSFAARNCGIEASTGEIIAFTDSDCLPSPTWLYEGTKSLEKDLATIVGGKIEYLDPPGRTLNTFERFEEAFFLLNKQKYLVESLSVSATANTFALKDVFRRVGLFDPNLMNFADGDWTQRAVRAGEVLRYSELAVVRHPRRSTYREVRRKTKRIAGDRIVLLEKAGANRRKILQEIFRLSPLDPRVHLAIFRFRNMSLIERAKMWFFGAGLSFAATKEKLRVTFGGTAFRG